MNSAEESALQRLIAAKDALAVRDTEQLYRNVPPNAPAAEHDMRELQTKFPEIPNWYLDFLREHDGWPGFFLSMDLFDSSTIGQDSTASAIVQGITETGLAPSWLKHAITVGASDLTNDLLVIDVAQGTLSWWGDSQEIARYNCLADFLDGFAHETHEAASVL